MPIPTTPPAPPTGPVVVLTGATSGLGRLAALDLAARGAHLILPARDPDRAQATVDAVRARNPSARTEVVEVDLTRLHQVRAAGRRIAQQHEHVDVLVNNAGVHAFTPRTTVDGLPQMVAVNYLAPWVLTQALLPALRRSAAARVVTVASEASRRHGTLSLPDDLTDLSPFTARGSSPRYGKTKLLDIMFTLELAERLRGTSVVANCLDPGFNVTGLGRDLRLARPLELLLTRLRIGDPRRGAGLIVHLATHPSYGNVSGRYVTVRGPREITPAAPADDPAARRRLWNVTEELLHERVP